MARIDKRLIERLIAKLQVSKSRVYALIEAKANSAHLPRQLAAIAVATERGINVAKYATDDDLAQIRQSARDAAPKPVVLDTHPVAKEGRSKPRTSPLRKTAQPKRRGTTVFVVHGRDNDARQAVFQFLRSLGLRPLEWSAALSLTRKGSPFVGEVLDAAFQDAVSLVILLTPDDDAKLRPQFLSPKDERHERELTGQARPNVLFEAGMALGRNPNSTVLVQLGDIRPFSDIGGRHVLHLNDSPEKRREFATKLANAGCNVDTSGTDWLSVGDFSPRPLRLAAKRTRRKPK